MITKLIVATVILLAPSAGFAQERTASQLRLTQFGGASGGGANRPWPRSFGTGNPGLSLPSQPSRSAPEATTMVEPIAPNARPTQSIWQAHIPGFSGGMTVVPPRTFPRAISAIAARCCPACMCGGDPAPSVGSEPGRPGGTATDLGNAISKWPVTSDKSFSAARNPFSFATTVALQYANDAVKCTGILVSKSKILTAAHCACEQIPAKAFFGDSAFPDVAAANGPGVRGTVALQNNASFLDASYCNHLEARRSGHQPAPALGTDLALLTLSAPLPEELARSILPVDPIANSSDASELYAVGFGYADETRWGPGIKNYARLKFTARLCTAAQGYGCQAGFESIAVGYDAARHSDSCEADSGGPLFVKDGDRMKLIGIVSRGISSNCGDGGIYTSLEARKNRDWLARQLAEPR